MKLSVFSRLILEKISFSVKTCLAFCKKKAEPWFNPNKNLFLLIFLVVLIFFLNWRWSNLEFLVRANFITLLFIFPFLFLFLWLYRRNSFGTKESFWTVISVLTAVLFFLFQNANQAATKGSLIYAAHQYNCSVADNILALEGANKRQNITLNYFATEPYIANVDLLFGNYSEELGRWLLVAILKMQGANSLLAMVQGFNIQGVNLLNKTTGVFIEQYHLQLIDIAKEVKANLPCNVSSATPTLFQVISRKFF